MESFSNYRTIPRYKFVNCRQKNKGMKRSLYLLIIFSFLLSCHNPVKKGNEKNSFSFVFLTDIHVEPERNATAGLMQPIDTINKLNPDFVLTGENFKWKYIDCGWEIN